MAADSNPYQAPRSRVAPAVDDGVDLERVLTGQKLVLFSILLTLAATLLRIAMGTPGFAVGLIAMALSIWGIVRLAGGLGLSLLMRIVLVLLMLVPLINLVTLMIFNSRALRVLRDAGHKVGPLGIPR
jgi:hypothetical protein